MRRTAWLALSPWLVVAVASVAAAAVGYVLNELLTTEGGGLGNLGGILLAVAIAGLVGYGGSVALLYVVARRAFPVRVARAAVGWAVLAAVVGGSLVGAALGFFEGGGVPFVVGLVPACLPAAATAAFLVADRRTTGRAVPPGDGRRRAVPVAFVGALAGALVGATVGVVVDLVALGPSQDELASAARELVPPGYAADEPVPIGGTVLLHARATSRGLDLDTIEETITTVGWSIDDVERSPREVVLAVSRGDVDATVVVVEGRSLPYSVTVRRGQALPRVVPVGAVLGAGAGAAWVLLRGRRPRDATPAAAGPSGAVVWHPER